MFRPMLFRHVRTFAAASVGESSFQKVVRVFESTTIELTNAQKLEFYGLFKTATIGTVAGDQPSMMNFVKRAKWDAWSEAANSMDQQQAEDAYKTKACHLMGLTLSEVESKTTLHEADDEAILSGSSSSSSSTSSVPDSSASFRHRELREICGMHSAAAGDVNISLVARAKDYTCVSVQVDAKDGVAVVNLSRPEKMNAMSIPLWEELIDVFDYCSRDPAVRCVVLGGDGEHFCSGMDLGVFATMASLHEEESCQGRKREHLKNLIEYFQNGCSAPELCHVPVLAAIHGNAVGGAIDLLTSCDMRYCVNDAMFCVKEIDLGIVADVGTTQRLPKLVGDQRARELTYTARPVDGKEAERIGIVLDSFETKDQMMEHVMSVARTIASKSPLTIRGIKQVSLYNRDHPNVDEGLEHVKMWNTSYLFSDDLTEAATAMMTKREPSFTKT